MAYLYGWFAGGDDLFYIGYSGIDDNYTRSKRCIGVTSKYKPSRSEQYYMQQNILNHSVSVKILIDDIDNKEALLLESCLIILYKKELLNCNHLRIKNVKQEYKKTTIYKTIKSLRKIIKDNKLEYTTDLTIYGIKDIANIEYELFDGYWNRCSNRTFKDKFGMDVRTFIKKEELHHHKIKTLEICDKSGIYFTSKQISYKKIDMRE